MNQQPTLWDQKPTPAATTKSRPEPKTYHNGSATSQKAAQHAEPGAESQCGRILAFARSRPSGVTREEVARATGLPINVVTPRCVYLIRSGLLHETGEVRQSETTGENVKVMFARLAKEGSAE